MGYIKPISFTCAIVLLLAILKMPAGYYTFLRLFVTVCGITIIAGNVKTLHPAWLILFVIITLMFNPVIPVYFYKKSLWLPIDIVSAIIFTLYGIQYKHNKT